jgi:hypothetical protein
MLFGLIKPVRKFHDKAPVFVGKILCKGVAGIYDEQVRYRCKTPLKPDVGVQIVNLIVILDQGSQEQLISKGNIQSGANQDQFGTIVWFWQRNIVVIS